MALTPSQVRAGMTAKRASLLQSLGRAEMLTRNQPRNQHADREQTKIRDRIADLEAQIARHAAEHA